MTRTHFGLTKAQRQADWMGRFAETLLAQHPRLSGRIDWDAARHYFLSGTSIPAAVDQYCLARNLDGARP